MSNFTGVHLDEHSMENVTEIWVWSGKFAYFPDGIGKLFKKLEKITVSYGDRNLGLKTLQRRSFKDMLHLWYLLVHYNEIEFVAEDALRDLLNLETFSIENNKLKKLYRSTFSRNIKLKVMLANSNELEFLDKDLFRNNPLLEFVSFKDNKLMIISIDLTNFGHLKNIDFRGNKCFNNTFYESESKLSDFQALLTQNCTKAFCIL